LKTLESLANKTTVHANKTKVFCSFEIISMKGGAFVGQLGVAIGTFFLFFSQTKVNN
jgi:hypothetical protein